MNEKQRERRDLRKKELMSEVQDFLSKKKKKEACACSTEDHIITDGKALVSCSIRFKMLYLTRQIYYFDMVEELVNCLSNISHNAYVMTDTAGGSP
jgi:hypothetical protein